jgi:hypothetical protein
VRAAVYHRVGSAREVLELRDLPEPEPRCGEVRVRLAFSAVNPPTGGLELGSSGLLCRSRCRYPARTARA